MEGLRYDIFYEGVQIGFFSSPASVSSNNLQEIIVNYFSNDELLAGTVKQLVVKARFDYLPDYATDN